MTKKLTQTSKTVVKKITQKVISKTEPDNKMTIIETLNKIMNIYVSAGDKGRVLGYRKAISSLK